MFERSFFIFSFIDTFWCSRPHGDNWMSTDKREVLGLLSDLYVENENTLPNVTSNSSNSLGSGSGDNFCIIFNIRPNTYPLPHPPRYRTNIAHEQQISDLQIPVPFSFFIFKM